MEAVIYKFLYRVLHLDANIETWSAGRAIVLVIDYSDYSKYGPLCMC